MEPSEKLQMFYKKRQSKANLSRVRSFGTEETNKTNDSDSVTYESDTESETVSLGQNLITYLPVKRTPGKNVKPPTPPPMKKLEMTVKPQGIETDLHALSTVRTEARKGNEISKKDVQMAKKLFSVPTKTSVENYEALLHELVSTFTRYEAVFPTAVRARLMVYIGSCAIDVATVLRHDLVVHRDILLSLEGGRPVLPTKRRRNRFLKKKKNEEHTLSAFNKLLITPEVTELLKSYGYEKEKEHPLISFKKLKKSFEILAEKAVSLANGFYQKQAFFEINDAIDKGFIFVSRRERDLKLRMVEQNLEKIRKISVLSKGLTLEGQTEGLEKLDKNGCNFLFPFVISNVHFNNPNIIEEKQIKMLKFLEETGELFMTGLKKQNILNLIEREILKSNET